MSRRITWSGSWMCLSTNWLYLYGYLNQVQSSRRLEREAGRNVECMWLTGKLAPDFKTIADFRRDNGEAIRAVCRQFVLLCREIGLIARGTVAVDGSRFKDEMPNAMRVRRTSSSTSSARSRTGWAGPLPNTKAGQSRNRDEPPHPRLQPETGSRCPGHPRVDRGDAGMRRDQASR